VLLLSSSYSNLEEKRVIHGVSTSATFAINGSDGSYKSNWTNWELNCINNAVGTGPKGRCTVNMNNVANNSFNLVVQLMGSTSAVCNNVVEVIKKTKTKSKKKKKNLTNNPKHTPNN